MLTARILTKHGQQVQRSVFAAIVDPNTTSVRGGHADLACLVGEVDSASDRLCNAQCISKTDASPDSFGIHSWFPNVSVEETQSGSPEAISGNAGGQLSGPDCVGSLRKRYLWKLH